MLPTSLFNLNFRCCRVKTPRRKVLIALGAWTLTPVVLFGQQPPAKVPRIGILSPFNSSSDTFRDAVQQRLQELGYTEGRNIVIEYRASNDVAQRLPQLAADLVALKVDAIVTTTAAGVQAAKQATATIPIVMAGVDDAVGQGFVTNLAKPGGNITGSSWLNTELSAKRVALLKQMLPRISRVALLREAVGGASSLQAIEASARTLGLRLVVMEIRAPDEVDGVFSALAQEHVGALMITQDPMLAGQERHVIDLAAKQLMPTIFSFRKAVEAGGLMSYGPRPIDLYRRGADYVDRILKGAKPGALPIEQPTQFELVINLNTARALGVDVPQAILLSADETIR
jgi:putative tryptophan/tyrosine transport system substrate-binding protein